MGAVGIVHAAEIRVVGPSAIEDYHAHLMRLDRSSLIPGDDRSIDSHCLELLASGAVLQPQLQDPGPATAHLRVGLNVYAASG